MLNVVGKRGTSEDRRSPSNQRYSSVTTEERRYYSYGEYPLRKPLSVSP
jgi:hypothetical protein